MRNPKENLLETIRGGQPDRYVNQFEAIALLDMEPMIIRYPDPEMGKGAVQNQWGVWLTWPDGTPGPFPLTDVEHLLIKDIEHWQDYLKEPDTNFTDAEWAPLEQAAAAVNRSERFAAIQIWPGLLETCHYLLGMETCMISFYEYPDEMHEIIEMLADFEIRRAKVLARRIHPDALYRHDDWGSQKSTFISPKIFREFLLEPTKRIYDCWRQLGVELIIHHSDSYCETLVPEMIEMGIDIWQGALSTNNLPMIAKTYHGKLTVMGGINSGIVDGPDWTPEQVEAETFRVLDWVDSPYFIPNLTQGCAFSTFPGVYEAASQAIERYNQSR